VESWDVVNEPMNFAGAGLEQNLFFQSMGLEYIEEAFQAAHDADPEARLFLNEFFLDYGGAKSDDFLNLLSNLLAAGVPIDGVGIQAHVQISVPDTADFLHFLQAVSDLGLTIELTEVDVAKTAFQTRLDEGEDLWELQAEVYDALASSCVAVAACQGITTWGIDDSHTWLDDEEYSPFWTLAPHEPLLLDAELNEKPAYFAVQERLAQRIP
jgi:endo-1,4-beta-xylanase